MSKKKKTWGITQPSFREGRRALKGWGGCNKKKEAFSQHVKPRRSHPIMSETLVSGGRRGGDQLWES